MARIIILNGVGSVGKSSTASALQSMLAGHFLHLSGDAFLDMIPPDMWTDPEGIGFTNIGSNDTPEIAITMGPAFERVMAGMRSAIATLAAAGNNCIVDDVMLSPSDQEDYRQKLARFSVSFVGLHAPLDVLEQRERDRGDRMLGLARWQFDRVHLGIDYDLNIETSQHSAEACAAEIARGLELPVKQAN